MNFYQKVYQQVQKIPKGKVATYGQVAALCGSPRAARQVGYALRACPRDILPSIPWQRVLNRQGFITISGNDYSADMQKQLLEEEDVVVIRKQDLWWVDLKRYLWEPN